MTKISLGKDYFLPLKKLLLNSIHPLSKISVAAIIVTDKGIFKGVNYEDPITNLGMCAERNAILNGITNGMKEIYEIHVLSDIPFIEMCGACRQVAGNFMKLDRRVYTYDLKTKKRKTTTLGYLMPNAVFPNEKQKQKI